MKYTELAACALTLVVGFGCSDDSDPAAPGGAGGSAGGGGAGGAGGDAVEACGPDDAGPNETLGPGADPAAGIFTIDQALADLPEGSGPLRAIISTEHGEITCALEPQAAPNAVANFVGLACGQRPWRDPPTGEWVKRRFYDGLIFHRIIDDFMAQGGDPLGTGTGGPGYSFDDEFDGLVHTPGTLSYANAGPNTNGSQFFITEVATSHLNDVHTIIGYCEPMATIEMLTATPTDTNDRPETDVHTTRIEVTRRPIE